jgi:hypothetical protein
MTAVGRHLDTRGLGKDSDFGDLATKGRAEKALLDLLKATGPAVAAADQARGK